MDRREWAKAEEKLLLKATVDMDPKDTEYGNSETPLSWPQMNAHDAITQEGRRR